MKMKISIIVLVLSLILNLFLLNKINSQRLDSLLDARIPDIELKGGLFKNGSAYFGSITGFTAFIDNSQQPQMFRQYRTITADYTLNQTDISSTFYIQDTYKMPYLAPSAGDPRKLEVEYQDERTLILSEDSDNKIKIDFVNTQIGDLEYLESESITFLSNDSPEAVLLSSTIDFANFIKSNQ